MLLANALIDSDDLNQLQHEAIVLDQSFTTWQETQVKDLKLWTAGHVSERQSGVKLGAGYWPGRVDSYFDLCIGCVWNTARTARLLLISLISKLSMTFQDRNNGKNINDDNNHSDFDNPNHQDVLRLIEDIISSIPFHLAEDLQAFLRGLEKDDASTAMKPGRHVGGLLLMHPLYVASKLPIVLQQMREYLSDCLEWIATNMGIGQASLFAKVRSCPFWKSSLIH